MKYRCPVCGNKGEAEAPGHGGPFAFEIVSRNGKSVLKCAQCESDLRVASGESPALRALDTGAPIVFLVLIVLVLLACIFIWAAKSGLSWMCHH